MTDIATLGIRVDSKDLARGEVALDGIADEAERTERRVATSAARMSGSFARTGIASRNMGGVVQQASYQVQDIVTQLQFGTRASVVFGQQLPQLASVFGGIGAAAGVGLALAAAAFGPLIDRLFQTQDAAEELEDKLDELASSFKALRQAQDLAALSTVELIERYGQADEKVQQLISSLQELAFRQFRGAADAAILAFGEMDNAISDAIDQLRLFETYGDRMNDASIAPWLREAIGSFQQLPAEMRVAASAVQNFALSSSESFEIQRDRALEAVAALEALNDPQYDPQIQALLNFADYVSQYLGRVKRDAVEAGAALSALARFQMGAMAEQYAQYGAGRAAGEALVRENSPIYGGTGNVLDPLGYYDDKKRSAGRTKAIAEQSAAMKAATSVINQAKQAALKFADVQAVIEDQFKTGKITAVEYAEALAIAKDRYSEMGTELEQVSAKISSSIEDSLMSLVDGTASVEDAFKSMARTIIAEVYRMAVVQPLVNGIMNGFNGGGGLSGFLGGIFGGKRADGGPISAGRTYLVGERGPELIVPQSSGTVIPNHALGGSGVTVHQTINVAGGANPATIRQEVAKLLPQIAEATKGAVIDARRRGGAMKATFG